MRPVALLEHHAKALTRIINHRLAPRIARTTHSAQAGFVAGASTADHLLTLTAALEDARQHQAEPEGKRLHLALLDCTKAFDSVELWALLKAYETMGLSPAEAKLLSCFDAGTAQVITPVGLSRKFHLTKGVRQGEVLSPNKFIAWLDTLVRTLATAGSGYHVQGIREPIRVLAFADDLVLLAESAGELAEIVTAAARFLHQCGVRINHRKTHYITTDPDPALALHFHDSTGEKFIVQRDISGSPFTYLGVSFELSSNTWPDQQRRWDSQVERYRLRRQLYNTAT